MKTSNRTPASGPAIHVKPSGQLTDTSDTDLSGLDRSITLEGDITIEELRDQLNSRVAVDVDSVDFKEFAGNLNFFEEKVLVRILPTAEKGAVNVIETFNDGVPQRFIRGEWVVAKRKFVEVLARAKPFSVSTPEVIDGNGNRTTDIATNNGQSYPFEMRDSNPRGAAWLHGILQEA